MVICEDNPLAIAMIPIKKFYVCPLVLILAGCASATGIQQVNHTPPDPPTVTAPPSVPTPIPTPTPAPTPTPTPTPDPPTPTPTPTPTPPAPPPPPLQTPLAQTITFPVPIPGTTFTVSATSSSGLSVTFSSKTPTICSVSGSTVTELLSGMCTIEADQSGNGAYLAAPSVTQTINIGQFLTLISVTPANATAPAQFTALVLDQFNQPLVPQPTFIWASDNAAAIIDTNGNAVGQSVPNQTMVNITASAGGVTSAPAVLTVLAATPILTTVTLSPSSATISAPSGSTIFSVTELDQFGRPMSPSAACTYSSDNLAAATIDNTGAALSQNATPNMVTANISATCGGLTTNSAVLTVTPQASYAASLVVANAQVQQSLSTSVSVTALDQYGNPFSVGQIDVNPGFDTTIIAATAQNSSEGNQVLITGLSVGTTTVTVHIDTDDSVSTTFTVTVIACVPGVCYTPVLTTISVTGQTQTMDYQGTQTFMAQAFDQKGGGYVATFTWSSTNTSVLTVDVNGNATAVGLGTATIQAMSGGVTGTSSVITVNPAPPAPISISAIFPTVGAARVLTTPQSSRPEPITIIGTGFVSGAVVSFGSDSTPANTIYQSSTQLIVMVPATDLNVTVDTTVPITVTNPPQLDTTGPVMSNSVNFLITTQGMVSITFDDAYQSTYDNGLPVFQAANIPVTAFIITGNYSGLTRSDGYPYGWNNDNCPTVSPAPTTFDPSCFVGVGTTSNYMTWAEVYNIANASVGNEIGAHTRSHNSLSTISAADQVGEIQGALTDLVANGFTNVHTMAYPYGDYGCLTQDEIATEPCAPVAGNGTGTTAPVIGSLVESAGYTGARSSDTGFEGDSSGNPSANLPFYLASYSGDVTPGDAMTTAQLTAIVQAAMAKGSWVIFLFHRVDECNAETPPVYALSTACPAGTSPNPISIDDTALQGLATYLTTNGIRTVTVSNGLAIEGFNGQVGTLVFPTE
jgi:peptidoglycan/xylan/chitin deacetylase (PgdA/CDA1 family)